MSKSPRRKPGAFLFRIDEGSLDEPHAGRLPLGPKNTSRTTTQSEIIKDKSADHPERRREK